MNKNYFNIRSKEEMSLSAKKSWEVKDNTSITQFKEKVSNKNKELHRKGVFNSVYFGNDSERTQKAVKNAWTKEAIEKRNQTRKERNFQKGSNNSQFGKISITNGIENRMIKKEDPIPTGWKKGRTLKSN